MVAQFLAPSHFFWMNCVRLENKPSNDQEPKTRWRRVSNPWCKLNPMPLKTTAIHHIGYTVPDLEQATQFFVDVLGFELSAQHGPFDEAALGGQFGTPDGGTLRFTFLKLGGQTLELVEWTKVEQNTHSPLNSDHGGRHLALSVQDVDDARAMLSQVPGVQLLEPRGAFFYFVAPWGMLVQIVPA